MGCIIPSNLSYKGRIIRSPARESYLTWSGNLLYKGDLTGEWEAWVTLPFTPDQILFLGEENMVARSSTSEGGYRRVDVWGSQDRGETWSQIKSIAGSHNVGSGSLWPVGNGRFMLATSEFNKYGSIWLGDVTSMMSVAHTCHHWVGFDECPFMVVNDTIFSMTRNDLPEKLMRTEFYSCSVYNSMSFKDDGRMEYFGIDDSFDVACCLPNTSLKVIYSHDNATWTCSTPSLKYSHAVRARIVELTMYNRSNADEKVTFGLGDVAQYYDYNNNGWDVVSFDVVPYYYSEDASAWLFEVETDAWVDKAREWQGQGDAFFYDLLETIYDMGGDRDALMQASKIERDDVISRSNLGVFVTRNDRGGNQYRRSVNSDVRFVPTKNNPGDPVEVITGYLPEDEEDAVHHRSSIITSNDGGATWSFSGFPPNDAGLDFFTSGINADGVLIVSGNNWRASVDPENDPSVHPCLLRSTDGSNWTIMLVGEAWEDYYSNSLHAFADLGQGIVLFAPQYKSVIYLSPDYGQTWGEGTISLFDFAGNLTVVSKAMEMDGGTLSGGMVLASVNSPNGPQLAYSSDQGITWTLGATLPATNPIVYPYEVS